MPDASRPTAAALAGLAVDDWSALLAVALPVVRELPERLVDATVQRVVAVPPGRLASGRSREDLARVLARREVWDLVAAALPEDAPQPWLEDEPPTVDDEAQTAVRRLEQQVEHLTNRESQLRAKVTALRAEVDDLRRERDGAVARADAAEAREREAAAAAATAQEEAEAAARSAAAADQRIEREVARTRRRDDAEVAGLEDRLRQVRRERDEFRQEASTARAEVARLRTAAATAPASVPPPVQDDRGGRRGRPSRLPEGIAAGTRRAAEWLVADGRVLLVDGYNVTRTHRADLSFPEQRRWLEEAVATLAQRRHVDATIIWDSAHGTATTRRSRRGLTVRFARADATADDELVLHVQLALDPATPVVVVTDDGELRTRLAQHGVDLLDSTSFTWLL